MARKRSSEAPVFEIDGKPVSKSTYYRAKKNGKAAVAVKPRRGRPPGRVVATALPLGDTQRKRIAAQFATDHQRDQIELVVQSEVDKVLIGEFLFSVLNSAPDHDAFTMSRRTAKALVHFLEGGA